VMYAVILQMMVGSNVCCVSLPRCRQKFQKFGFMIPDSINARLSEHCYSVVPQDLRSSSREDGHRRREGAENWSSHV